MIYPGLRLSDADAIFSYQGGRGRQDNGETKIDLLAVNRDATTNHQHGLGAEVAGRRVLTPWAPLPVPTEMPRADLVWKGDETDVKWNRDGRFLNVGDESMRPAKRCRRYVYVAGEIPFFWLVGWLYDDEIFQEKYRVERGKHLQRPGSFYRVPAIDLRAFDAFALVARHARRKILELAAFDVQLYEKGDERDFRRIHRTAEPSLFSA